MDPGSLTVLPLPTITLPLSPTPSPPSSASTPVPLPLNSTSQISIMSGIVRNKAAGGAGAQQPPRPPNAWILYRSDKLQELPPPPLGHPKPTQAEVSKIISAQWRAETDSVRALYEQRAEMAKAEHARLYPNYRFAPMKKADKDRIREEKRQAKEQERASRRVRGRVAPYPSPSAAPTFRASVPLSIQHVYPNASCTSPSTSSSSSSSPSSMTPPSQPCVSEAPCHGSSRVTPDASIDPQLPPVNSQTSSSRESSCLGVTVPPATPLPMVPPRLVSHTPQPSPLRDWKPLPSDPSTTFPNPPEEISLPDWPPTLPQSTQASHETSSLHFTIPNFDPSSLQHTENESPLAGLYTDKVSGAFSLQDFVGETLIAPPPDSIDVGMGIYSPSMYGPSTLDDPFPLLPGDQEPFMLSPTVEQLLASMDSLVQTQPQENDSPSSDLTPIDPMQAFNFDDFVKDFVLSAPQEPAGDALTTTGAPAEHQSIAVTLSVSQHSSALPNLHSASVMSPMPSFYVSTPSPGSTGSTSSPVTRQPYVPPRGAANANVRRVGGSWTVPMAVSRLASPIPSCTASSKVVA